MTTLRRIVAAWLLLVANARAAQPDWPRAPLAQGLEPRVSLTVTNRVGLVEAPFFSTAFPRVSGFGMLLVGDAGLRIRDVGWFHLSLPLTVVRLDFPARAQVAESALGNLELGFVRSAELGRETHVQMTAAALIPTAQSGPEGGLLKNRALALANALNGGLDSAQLTPGVAGLRLRASVERSFTPFDLSASPELPVLVRLSDAHLPDDSRTRAVGLLPSLDLRAAFWVSRGVGASLGAALLAEPLRVQEPALARDRSQRLQPILEPALHFQVGRFVSLGLDGRIPVAGSLGGRAWSVGMLGRLDLP